MFVFCPNFSEIGLQLIWNDGSSVILMCSLLIYYKSVNPNIVLLTYAGMYY